MSWALSSNHYNDWGWSTVVVLASILNSSMITVVRWALKTCSRNSSPILNTLTSLVTRFRWIISRKLHSEPCWPGFPQKILNTTLKHSHRKWLTLYRIIISILPGTSHAHDKRSFTHNSLCLHSLLPLIFLHVSWSPLQPEIHHMQV